MPSSASRPRRPAPTESPASPADATPTGAVEPQDDVPPENVEPDDVRGRRPDAPPEDAPKRSSRAGRNLPVAIGVGLAMGAVALIALLTVRQTWIGDPRRLPPSSARGSSSAPCTGPPESASRASRCSSAARR